VKPILRSGDVFALFFGKSIPACRISVFSKSSNSYFTITAEILARSLANFCQYADRYLNVQYMRRFNEQFRAIRQFVILKNKLMSVYNASVLSFSK